ncbi:MAG: cytochrome c biosis protein [Thermodesulfobacteriota bacterium]|nr:cytochrome c biosis protein [Thermodesulfobacteriota bacterium]
MTKQKNPFWSFFTSVYLTITLLALMVILSIVGTLIPQQDAARGFIQGISPGLASFLQTMQAFDVFHSVRMEVLLSRKYRKIIVNCEQEDALIICGERGRYSRFAVYAVHVSLLLLIMGAFTGAFWGWEGYVNIEEGETADAIDLKGAEGTKKLPFTIRCDKFLVAFYENGAPKTFRSDLTFLKDGKTLFQGPLLVNHPISLEGVRVYQASYGSSPDGRASLAFSRGGGEEKIIVEGVLCPRIRPRTPVQFLRIPHLLRLGSHFTLCHCGVADQGPQPRCFRAPGGIPAPGVCLSDPEYQ